MPCFKKKKKGTNIQKSFYTNSQVIVKQKPIFVKPKLPVVPSPKLIPRSSIMWATPASKCL